jgi:hypothetical protein
MLEISSQGNVPLSVTASAHFHALPSPPCLRQNAFGGWDYIGVGPNAGVLRLL